MVQNHLSDQNWTGMLTPQNAAEVSERIQRFVKDKKFTIVFVNEYRKYKPQVNTNQLLIIGEANKLVHFWVEERSPYVNMILRTTDTGFCLYSNTTVESPTSTTEPDNTKIEFRDDQVIFTCYMSDKKIAYYVIALEK